MLNIQNIQTQYSGQGGLQSPGGQDWSREISGSQGGQNSGQNQTISIGQTPSGGHTISLEQSSGCQTPSGGPSGGSGQMSPASQSPSAGQLPAQGQMPSASQRPTAGQLPAQGQMPSASQRPASGQLPAQNQLPSSAQSPAADQLPAQGMMPVQGETAVGPLLSLSTLGPQTQQMVQGSQLDMKNRLPDEVVNSPLTLDEAHMGSMKAMLGQNIGNYVVATFLIGTQNTTAWEGVLFEVGNDYVVIFQEHRDRYIVCDLYSLKHIEFYNTRRQALCETLIRNSGWQNNGQHTFS